MLLNHSDHSPEANAARKLVEQQHEYVKGKYDPSNLYFNSEPGVLPDYVSADVSVKVSHFDCLPKSGCKAPTPHGLDAARSVMFTLSLHASSMYTWQALSRELLPLEQVPV